MYTKILFFLWLFAITVISLVDYSSIAGLNLAKKGFGSGFYLHLACYFVAAWLLFLAYFRKRAKFFLLTMIGLFLLGTAFEIAQLFIPKRTFNPTDVAANGLGLAAFYVCRKIVR